MIFDRTNSPSSESATVAPPVADTYVHARIDTLTKARASSALHAMGLSVSDAIRLLMQHLASEHCLPSGMKAPGVPAAQPVAEPQAGESKESAYPG